MALNTDRDPILGEPEIDQIEVRLKEWDALPDLSPKQYPTSWQTAQNLVTTVRALRKACEAAIAYDAAIQKCAGDPEAMSSFCTARGEDLDGLYADWLKKARKALKLG